LVALSIVFVVIDANFLGFLTGQNFGALSSTAHFGISNALAFLLQFLLKIYIQICTTTIAKNVVDNS
jgi:hypothetical protein